MPRPVNYPNVFGSLSGQVSASLLDQNFNAAGSIINDSASGWVNAALDTGSANAYIVTLTPPATEYAPGFFLSWMPLNANTGPSSINVNNLGNTPILTANGSALYPGALQPGTIYSMIVINSAFRIVTPDLSSLIGEVRLSGATTWPVNWLLCNGAAVSRTQYAALFLATGIAYGPGDGSTTFNLPLISTGIFPTGGSPGARGGNNSVTLGVANMPAHNHPINIFDPSHAHTYVLPSTTITTFSSGASFINAVTSNPTSSTGPSLTGITATSSNTGSGSPFPIVPLFVGFNFLIRAF